MTLTKDHKYTDRDGDSIEVWEAKGLVGDPAGTLAIVDTTDRSGGVFVAEAFAAPLALNILGHDRPEDDPLATSFDVNGELAHLADSKSGRDTQLNVAAALLMAVDGYDRREKRRASAEERRTAAAKSLTDAVVRLHIGAGPLTGDEIGKLREALGRYDAALAN